MPVPQIQEHLVDAVNGISQERTQQRTVEQIEDAPDPQIVDVLVLHIQVEILQVTQLFPQVRTAECVIWQTINVLPPQMQEQFADPVRHHSRARPTARSGAARRCSMLRHLQRLKKKTGDTSFRETRSGP